MKLLDKINSLTRGKQIAIKIVIFIVIWNIVLLPIFLITNNCMNNAEKKWFFEEATKFIQESEQFNEEYGNIISVENVDVMLDKSIDKTVAILKINVEKQKEISCKVVFEPVTADGGAVYPSYYLTE